MPRNLEEPIVNKSVRFFAKDLEILNDLANKRGVTFSDLVREIIRDFINGQTP